MSRILLVDDDADMLLITSNWLKRAGYEVVTKGSGKEALDFLAGEKPDLVVLDYAMPDVDGPAVFLAMQESDLQKNTPVLFRTGMEDPDSTALMEQLKSAGVIPKSEGKKRLLEAVERALS